MQASVHQTPLQQIPYWSLEFAEKFPSPDKIPPDVFLFFMQKSANSHEPIGGTGTTGPGEAVFAIRIVGFKGIE